MVHRALAQIMFKSPRLNVRKPARCPGSIHSSFPSARRKQTSNVFSGPSNCPVYSRSTSPEHSSSEKGACGCPSVIVVGMFTSSRRVGGGVDVVEVGDDDDDGCG